MTDNHLIEAAATVRKAFAGRPDLTVEQVRTVLGDDEVVAPCIRFLRERDELLLVAGGNVIYHRPTLVDRVYRLLARAGALTPEEINERLSLPSAITCEVLGWLELEGRVRAQDEGEALEIVAT